MAGLVAIPGAVLSPAGAAGAVELPARTAPGTTGRLAMESLGTAGLEPLRTQVAAELAARSELAALLPPQGARAATEPSSMRAMALAAGEAGEAALRTALVAMAPMVEPVGT